MLLKKEERPSRELQDCQSELSARECYRADHLHSDNELSYMTPCLQVTNRVHLSESRSWYRSWQDSSKEL